MTEPQLVTEPQHFSSASLSIAIPIRVYIEDTDAGGIVFYVNYLKYMERARTELFRALGYGKAALFDTDKMFVVTSQTTNYHHSARLDDELVVTAKIKQLARVSVVFEQEVLCNDRLLCSGDVKVACVHRVSSKPVRMPANLVDRINAELPLTTGQS